MLSITPSTQFRRDVKKAHRRGKNIDKLEAIINQLQRQKSLPKKYRDHALTGNWKHHRECHIEPDWLLIYQIDLENQKLRLSRTGTHADLFGK